MSERERLIELIGKAKYLGLETFKDRILKSVLERLADHLLKNGVIVPPVEVGQTIYRIYDRKIYDWWEVESIRIYADETVYFDDSENIFRDEDIGKTVFLTKEQAEKALKGGAENEL